MAKLEVRFPDGAVETVPLDPARSIVIGSADGSDVQLTGAQIQPKHAVIRFVDRRYRLDVDAHAKNVFVGVNPVTQLRLKPDAEFSIAGTEFRIRYDADELGVVLMPSDQTGPLTEAKSYRLPLYRSRAFLSIVAGLIVLMGLGVGLYFLVRVRAADRMMESARTDLNDGLYSKSISGFDQFLSSFPDDPRADQAIYLRAKSRLLEKSEGSAVSWLAAREAAQQMFDEAGKTAEFAQHPTEIGELFVSIARGLAEEARNRADPAMLTGSEEMLELIKKAVPADDQPTDDLERVRALQVEGRLAVERDSFITTALADIDKSLTAQSPIEVYATRTELIHRYPELARDKRVEDRLRKAADLDQALVRFETTAVTKRVEAATEIGSAWTIYDHTPDLADGDDSQAKILPVTVGDVVYGLNRLTGKVQWRTPVGFPTTFLPTLLAGDGTPIIAYQGSTNELVLLADENGSVTARISLGDYRPRSECEILISADRLFLPATSIQNPKLGAVLCFRIRGNDLAEEFVIGFPQPIVTAPGFDADRETLIVVGEQATMYLVNLARRSVESSFTLGHQPGAIRLAPVMAGRFCFLLEAKGTETSVLRTLVIKASGTEISDVSRLDIDGTVPSPPIVRGGRVFLATDQGETIVLDLGAENDPNPVTKSVALRDRVASTGAAPFCLATDENNVWVISDSARRYRVRVAEKRLDLESEIRLSGPAWRESRLDGDDLLLIAGDNNRVEAVRAQQSTGTRSWTTNVGRRPWAVGAVGEDSLRIAYGQEPLELKSADFTEDAIKVLSPMDPPEGVADRAPAIAIADTLALVDRGTMWMLPASGPAKRVTLPGPASGPAKRCGNGLLVPSETGYVFWLSTDGGAELADPFAAPIENGSPRGITAVVPLNADDPAAGAIGGGGPALFRLNYVNEPSPAWQSTSRVALEGDGEILDLILGNGVLWCIRTEDVVALDPETLENRGSIPASAGPFRAVAIGKSLWLVDQNRSVQSIGLGPDQKPVLAHQVALATSAVGPVLVQADRAWIATEDGTLTAIHPENGTTLAEVHTGRGLTSGPWLVGDRLVVVGMDGSLIARPIP